MRIKNKFTKNQLEEITKEDLSLKEIISILHCDRRTLNNYLKMYGLKEKFKKATIDNEELYRLRVNSLWTTKELAELYRVSVTNIQIKIRKFPPINTYNEQQRSDYVCN